MSAWGVGLYQDDVTCDIKSNYLNWLKVGKSNIEATQKTIDFYSELIEDEEDVPLFWFALADIQWKYGRLLPEVKQMALKYIRDGNNLRRWENNKLYIKRKKVLENLEIRLNSEQPPEKKVSKLKLTKSLWDIGDVLLYKLRDSSLHSKWDNKYILLQVIGKTKVHIGTLPVEDYYNEYSIIGLYNWVGNNEPDLKIIEKLRMLAQKDFWGKETQDICYLNFSKIQMKRLNFKVVMKNNKIKKENHNGLGIFANVYNIDSVFIDVLIEAEKNGDLIDEAI